MLDPSPSPLKARNMKYLFFTSFTQPVNSSLTLVICNACIYTYIHIYIYIILSRFNDSIQKSIFGRTIIVDEILQGINPVLTSIDGFSLLKQIAQQQQQRQQHSNPLPTSTFFISAISLQEGVWQYYNPKKYPLTDSWYKVYKR